jgi:hypothetical protein
LIRWFTLSVGAILTVTGSAKAWASVGNAKLLTLPDPVIGVEIGHLMLAIGVVEIAFGQFCFFSKRWGLIVVMIACLSTGFSVYRLGLFWMNIERPCPCLGNLSDALHIHAQTADNIMKVILTYLVIGSYGILFGLYRQEGRTEALPLSG